MKKSNRKVDLIIIIILTLIILAVILMIVLSGQRTGSRFSDEATRVDDYNGREIGVETGTHYGSVVKKRLPDAKVFLFDNCYDL